MTERGSITRLLDEVRDGLPGAEDRLFARVYDELRVMAGSRARRDGDAQPSDLVHDAYLRIDAETLENRRHLFFAYARAMRQVIIDRERRRNADKRGGGRRPLALAFDPPDDDRPIEPLELDGLLDRLREASPREAQAIELRCFGGLSDKDIGDLLGVSDRTVRNDLKSARQRLQDWVGE